MPGEQSARENTILQIASDLQALGIQKGGVVLVHSSLRSLGPLAGGAESVVQAFLEVLGADGTLLMPALSYEHVTTENPLFDVKQTPSNVGALAEYFRTPPRHTAQPASHTFSLCSRPTGKRAVDENMVMITLPAVQIPHSVFCVRQAHNSAFLAVECVPIPPCMP